MIDLSLRDLIENPETPLARPRPEIGRGLRTLRIARPGRRASHFLLYRIAEDGAVEVVRFLHDAMDLPRHVEGIEKSS